MSQKMTKTMSESIATFDAIKAQRECPVFPPISTRVIGGKVAVFGATYIQFPRRRVFVHVRGLLQGRMYDCCAVQGFSLPQVYVHDPKCHTEEEGRNGWTYPHWEAVGCKRIITGDMLSGAKGVEMAISREAAGLGPRAGEEALVRWGYQWLLLSMMMRGSYASGITWAGPMVENHPCSQMVDAASRLRDKRVAVFTTPTTGAVGTIITTAVCKAQMSGRNSICVVPAGGAGTSFYVGEDRFVPDAAVNSAAKLAVREAWDNH